MVIDRWTHLPQAERDDIFHALALIPTVLASFLSEPQTKPQVLDLLTGKGICPRAAVLAFGHALACGVLVDVGNQGKYVLDSRSPTVIE